MGKNYFTIPSSSFYNKNTCRESKKVNAEEPNDMDYNNICDDNELDDIDISYVSFDKI